MLTIKPIPAFSDNYIWCIEDTESRCAAVVDPGQAKPVLDYLNGSDLELTDILITHHHADHIGGMKELKDHYDCAVWGFERANFSGVDHVLQQGSTFELFGTQFQVIEVPGHTLDHIAFFSNSDDRHNNPWLFCGDTLFSGGCGRLFEGTPDMMLSSLDKLAQLPDTTQIFCAHEYTLANLRFAKYLMPGNAELANYIQTCQRQRERNSPTIPSTLAIEKKINPFLLSEHPEIRSTLGLKTEVSRLDCFAATRQAKDHF